VKRSTLWYAVQTLALLGLVVALVGCGDGTVKDKDKDGGGGGGAALTIAYSDWPGWLVWEIAVQKKYFDEAGVKVDMKWFEYGPSIDAFAAGKVDAVCVVCGDALTIGDKVPSTAIVLTDFSNGNDMIIAKKDIGSVKDLKGKKVGVEENLVEHILLAKALEMNGMTLADVDLVKIKTDAAPQSLQAGSVSAVGAWYPISGQALKNVGGSKAIFTSADAPGLIYDALHVNRKSLANRRADWKKVVEVWFKCLEFLNNEKTHKEAVEIMTKRIGGDAKPEELEANLKGTKLLDRDGNTKALQKGDTLDSVYGSMKNADKFYVDHKAYAESRFDDKYVDPSLVKEIVEKK